MYIRANIRKPTITISNVNIIAVLVTDKYIICLLWM